MSFSSSFLLSNTCLLCIGFFNWKKNEKGNYRVKYVTDFKYWIFSNLRGFKKYNEKNFLGTFQQHNHLNTIMLKMLKTVFNFLTIWRAIKFNFNIQMKYFTYTIFKKRQSWKQNVMLWTPPGYYKIRMNGKSFLLNKFYFSNFRSNPLLS